MRSIKSSVEMLLCTKNIFFTTLVNTLNMKFPLANIIYTHSEHEQTMNCSINTP